ncbi:hypothetical protein [Aureivirga sp. CE67]|uniref:hypothetical protein n=1 Tax=Aureivirga sp. CE67 TaxID=1788983 RepID=UPI0018CB92FF|nr:hypothetical protein [Aureivirga sp. CE67]
MKKVKQIPMVILYALIFTFLVNGMMVNLGSSMSLFLIMGLNFLGGIVLNTFFWNEYLGKDITYEAKSIQKPVLIFALMLVLLMVLQGFMMRA